MAKVMDENMTPEHVKAARALLRWTAGDLATESGLGAATVRRFESGRQINAVNKKQIYDTLIKAGAWFKNGGKPSVGLNKTDARRELKDKSE